MILFKGKKKGMVHTQNITMDHIRKVFFPRTFYERYRYLGSVPFNEEGDIFKSLEPLIIFLDYKAKPKWCPRWFLRFLYLFGNDNSIVRVRSAKLSNLFRKLTKGYSIWDYKTKWTDYDLRISVMGNHQVSFLADAIEAKYYEDGRRTDLAEKIKELDPETKYTNGYTITTLNEEYNRLLDTMINEEQ